MRWSTINLIRAARPLVLLTTLSLTRFAAACPVCSANQVGQPPQATRALLVSTAAMATLPFGLVGGLVWWLRKNL